MKRTAAGGGGTPKYFYISEVYNGKKNTYSVEAKMAIAEPRDTGNDSRPALPPRLHSSSSFSDKGSHPSPRLAFEHQLQ